MYMLTNTPVEGVVTAGTCGDTQSPFGKLPTWLQATLSVQCAVYNFECYLINKLQSPTIMLKLWINDLNDIIGVMYFLM